VNIIGTGTFGYVLLAEYRGTQVAVKRILPAGKKNNMALDPHSDRYESNPGLRSVAPRMARKALRSASLSGSSSTSGPINVRDRREILRNFVLEMRHIAMLRHPCITTVMGAVLRADEPMLVLEYMQLGSLYDVLRNETLENQLEENKMQILQDISRGMRFLHAADPRVVHGDLKARNVLVDSNFRAKVSDFGLSPNQRTASGTPYWMAPELLESRSSNSARSDIFAFGILMFEIFSRSNPYINERDPDIVLSQICDHGVNKRPTLPDSCPLKMVDLFEECVKWDPTARPTAEAIDLLLRVEGSVTERVYRLEALNRELAEANAKIASASAMQLEQ
jgi:guanylate cyclase